MELVRDLDHAAGVHHVVGRVEDAPVGEVLLDARVGELVVGRAADHLRGQHADGLVAEGAAERAGRVHVQALGADQRVGVGDRHHLRVRGRDLLDRLGAHVRDQDLGALLEQVAHQVAADLADARDADPAAAQRGVAPQVLRAGTHALVDAEGGEHRGVAGAAVLGGAAGHPAGGARDHVHVLDVGADVAGGDVAAAEGVDEAAVGLQQGLGLVLLGVADDHGLAAAVVQPGERVLVRHAAGEVEGVLHGGLLRVLLGGVGMEAGAAQSRAQGRGVDGDDRLQAGGPVLAEDDLLVAALLGVEQGVQDRTCGALRAHGAL